MLAVALFLPSFLGVGDIMDMKTATEHSMLALAIWKEGAGEPFIGKVAIAYSVLERVAHPGWWGRDLIGCLTKPYQFSSFTAPGDGQLIRWPQLSDPSYVEAWDAAIKALDKTASNPAPTSNSYYATSIKPPAWATPETFITQVGRHRFHRVPSPPPRKDT